MCRVFSAKINGEIVEIEAMTEEHAWWEFVDMAGGAGFEHLVKCFAEGESLWN